MLLIGELDYFCDLKMEKIEIKPDQSSDKSKKEQVEQMFDNIAERYDFLNRFLSMGIDRGWRKKAIQSLDPIHPKLILDVATGTGDLAIAAIKLHPDKVIGVDISELMLEVGREKIISYYKRCAQVNNKIVYRCY